MKKLQGEKNYFIEFLKNKAGFESVVEVVEKNEEADLGMIGLINAEPSVSLFDTLREKINDENLVNFDVEESLVLDNQKKINEIRFDFFKDYSKSNVNSGVKSFSNSFLSKYLATSIVAACVFLMFFSFSVSGMQTKAENDAEAVSRAKVQKFILENTRTANQRGVVAGAEESAMEEAEKSKFMAKLSNLASKQIGLSELMENKLLDLFRGN